MMAKKADKQTKLTDEITLSEIFPGHPDSGFWLYDERVGMNLAIRKESEISALLKALTYWKQRYIQLEEAHNRLTAIVDNFVETIRPTVYEED